MAGISSEEATSERFITAANNTFSQMLMNVSCSLVVTVSQPLSRHLLDESPPLLLLFDLTVMSSMDQDVVQERVSNGMGDGTFVKVLKKRSGYNVTSIVLYAYRNPSSSPVKAPTGTCTMQYNTMRYFISRVNAHDCNYSRFYSILLSPLLSLILSLILSLSISIHVRNLCIHQ